MKRKKKKRNRTEMGICWSEPPLPPATQVPVLTSNQPCRGCGSWQKQATVDYCEICLQKNAMKYMAPPYPTQAQYPQTQYTYAVPYQQQQQMQMYSYYQPRPPMYPPQQQQQMGVGTAMIGGFVLGAVAEDILDPTG